MLIDYKRPGPDGLRTKWWLDIPATEAERRFEDRVVTFCFGACVGIVLGALTIGRILWG